MARVVLDSSFALERALDQSRFKERRRLFENILVQGALVPAIWSLEIANVIVLSAPRSDRLIRPRPWPDAYTVTKPVSICDLERIAYGKRGENG